MFKEKNSTENTVLERNRIGKKTSIVGDIISEGDFRIDGTVEGTIKTQGRVIVGAEGIVKGQLDCVNADIEGAVTGTILVSEMLTLKSTAVINGDVVIGKLTVEPGASFNATCTMKGMVKELNKEEAARKSNGKAEFSA